MRPGPARIHPLVAWLGSASAAAWLLAALLVLAGLAASRVPVGLPAAVLLALLALGMLAAAYLRRPYDRARTGFLLVHAGLPAAILGGLLGPRGALPGLLALAAGLPWMFYLKPWLKPKPAKAPSWQRVTLQVTRILFLASSAALAPLAWGRPAPRWAWLAWPVLALVLHLHHHKAWKGWKAQAAALAGWGLCLIAFLALR